MITNLIVMDPNWQSEDGSARDDAMVYSNRIVCHPLAKEKMMEVMMEVMVENFGKDKPPIFISKGEWETMMIFSKNIRQATTPSEKHLYEIQYQRWWTKITIRAKEEADEWYKKETDNRSIKKSQSSKVTKFRCRKTK